MKQVSKVSIVLFVLLLLVSCGTSQDKKNKKENTTEKKQEIKVTTAGELATLDSALYTDIYSSDMIGQIMEGLYRIGRNNEAELGIAAEEPQISEDQRVYRYTLRNTTWSNGDQVTAADFVYAFQTIVDPAYKSPSSNQMDVIQNGKKIREGHASVDTLGIKALDSQTLEITLENPIPYLAKLLTGTPFMPKNQNFATEEGEKYGTSSKNVVSNGPFVIEGWQGTNEAWSLKKNTNYWDEKNVKLSKIDVSVIKEVATGINLFDANSVNFTVLSDSFVKQYQNDPNFHSVPKALIGYLGFNTKREIFSNLHVRKAIAQSINKESFVNNILGDGSLVLNGLVPGNFAKDPANQKEFRQESGNLLSYNEAEAKSEWETAKNELGMQQITLELLSSDSPAAKKTVEYIQAELEKKLVGLNVTIKSVPISNRLDLNRQGDFDFFFGTWTPDYADPINFLEVYESSGGLNFGKYDNQNYDQGINEVKTTLAVQPEERWTKMIELEKMLIQEDVAIAPIYQGSIAYLESPNIKNLQLLPFGRQLFYRQVEVND